jgi:hypothetical protein
VPKDEEEDEVDHKDTASTIIILRPGDPPTPLVAVCPSMVVLTHELAKLKGCSTPVSVIIDFDTDHETGRELWPQNRKLSPQSTAAGSMSELTLK